MSCLFYSILGGLAGGLVGQAVFNWAYAAWLRRRYKRIPLSEVKW